jgi:hypothetical protein
VALHSPQPRHPITIAIRPSAVTTVSRLSYSVVNSPSVTPPPNISTRIYQPRSHFEAPEAQKEPATSTTTDRTELESTSENSSQISARSANEASGLQTQIALSPPQSSVIALPTGVAVPTPEANLQQLRTENIGPPPDTASAELSMPLSSLGNQTMATSPSGCASVDESSATTSASGTTADSDASSSSTAASSATPTTSTGTWNQRNPLSFKDVILRSLDPGNLPEPKENEVLFLPVDADRVWYMGFLKEWSTFNRDAIMFWRCQRCRTAFEEIKIYPMVPPRAADSDITDESRGSEVLYSHFERQALEVVQKVYNSLMGTKPIEWVDQATEMFLGNARDEDLANAEVQWDPSFVVKTRDREDEETTRALGQIEYLGGRKGALTWAVSKRTLNCWGSLRCVLGRFFPSFSLALN